MSRGPGRSVIVFADPLVGAVVPPMRMKPRNPRVEFTEATGENVVVANS